MKLHDELSERAYLLSCLLYGKLPEQRIESKDFFIHTNKIIYQAILDLEGKEEIGLNSVFNKVLSTNLMYSDKAKEKELGKYIFNTIFVETVLTQSIESYTKTLLKLSKRRSMVKVLKSSIVLIEESDNDLELDFRKVQNSIHDIVNEENKTTGLVQISEMRNESINYIKNLLDNKGQPIGILTGYLSLDKILNGIDGHELNVLAGRPGTGKTTFVLNIAFNVAVNFGHVAFFSLEQSRIELLLKMYCMYNNINSTFLKSGNLSKKDHEKMIESIQFVTKQRLFIDDSGAISVQQIRANIQKAMINCPLKLIIIDYLQLIYYENGKTEVQALTDITRSLKLMAKDFNVPIILLSQLNRGVESRQDQRPKISDLRGSGSIEQDADKIMLMCSNPENKGTVEVIVAKNRNGATASTNLLFMPEYSKFREMPSDF